MIFHMGKHPTEPTSQQAYILAHRKHHHMVAVFRLLILLVFLIFWECMTRAGYIDIFFFSSPTAIIKYLYQMFLDASFFRHTGITLLETIVSFLLVTAFSLFFAMLLWYHKSLSEILEPYLVVLNSLPKSALAPLLIVWLGTGAKTIIVAGISVAVFGSIINLYTGFCQADKEMLKLIYTLGGSRKDAMFKVILPSSVPLILSNMKVNIGLCLVGVIIGEFLAARRGLGYLIIYGSQVFSRQSSMIKRLHASMESQIFSGNGADPVVFKHRCQSIRIFYTKDHAGLPVLLSENGIHILHIDPGMGDHFKHPAKSAGCIRNCHAHNRRHRQNKSLIQKNGRCPWRIIHDLSLIHI